MDAAGGKLRMLSGAFVRRAAMRVARYYDGGCQIAIFCCDLMVFVFKHLPFGITILALQLNTPWEESL